MVGHEGLCDNRDGMTNVSQEAFTQLLWVVVILGLIGAVAAIATSGEVFKQIGKGGLFNEDELIRPSPVSAAVRNDEIRQMLEARNVRRVRRGEEPLDIEQELDALTRTTVDGDLLDEMRELVEARNARRIRQGREPLDVQAEIGRQLRKFA
jgi:hypothetical protein